MLWSWHWNIFTQLSCNGGNIFFLKTIKIDLKLKILNKLFRFTFYYNRKHIKILFLWNIFKANKITIQWFRIQNGDGSWWRFMYKIIPDKKYSLPNSPYKKFNIKKCHINSRMIEKLWKWNILISKYQIRNKIINNLLFYSKFINIFKIFHGEYGA